MNGHEGEAAEDLAESWRGPRHSLRQVCTRAAAWAAIALAIVWLAYWSYGQHRKYTLPKFVIALVHDASTRLADALRGEIDSSSHDDAIITALERHAIAADQSLMKLRDIDAASIEELASAADEYLLTAREILRRRAAEYRHRGQVATSIGTLRAHMRADNRTGAWISQAVRHKTRLEADFRRYRITTAALADLLQQYAGSRARIAAHVDPPGLWDEQTASAAGTRILDALGTISGEVERAGQLNAYR
ncbi:MAG: hypothetical protein ACT4PS_04965 [Betaproteobacteria bacterium]